MSIMILSIRGTFHCINNNMLSTLSVFPCLNITKHYQLIKITRYILQCKKMVYSLSSSVSQFVAVSPRLRCCFCARSTFRCAVNWILFWQKTNFRLAAMVVRLSQKVNEMRVSGLHSVVGQGVAYTTKTVSNVSHTWFRSYDSKRLKFLQLSCWSLRTLWFISEVTVGLEKFCLVSGIAETFVFHVILELFGNLLKRDRCQQFYDATFW